MLRPPISRMGGKSKLRKTIIEMIPKHTCYVEPFFGAGWVYFGKEPSYTEVINDIDGELVNLFKMIKYHSDEVERLLKYEISARDIFKEYKETSLDSMTEIQRAVRYIYVISQSFGSKGTVYGYGTNTKPSPKIFDYDLNILKKRLRGTYVENLSFEKIFEKYDREYSFFFCDPPYYETDGYANVFKEEEQLKLLNMVKNIRGKFLITLNDHPKVREWYKQFNFKEVEVSYSVSKNAAGRKKYKELIITNF